MKNLVGVGVADATEDVRIGQRALQRVIALGQPGTERCQIGIQDFEPLRIERSHRFGAANDVNGCLTLRLERY